MGMSDGVSVRYAVNKADVGDITSPVAGDIGQRRASDRQDSARYQGSNIFNLRQCLLEVWRGCEFGSAGIRDDAVMGSRRI